MGNRQSNAGDTWDAWYRRHGHRVISTHDWRREGGFFDSGLRDVEYVSQRFGIPTSGTAHEIGCGPGRVVSHLQSRYEVVTANDVSQAALDDCAAIAGPNVRLLLGGPQVLSELPTGSYDTVVSIAVLQHIDDCDEVLAYIREAARLLKPSGVGVLQLSNASILRRLQDAAVDLAREVTGATTRAGHAMPRGRHWRGCRPDDTQLLDAATSSGSHAEIDRDRQRTWIRIGTR